jgi:hypothetical protein
MRRRCVQFIQCRGLIVLCEISLSHEIARVREALLTGPKTSRELRALKVSKEAISRAVRRDEVLDDAAVRQRSGFVALYYLNEEQLDMRTDVEVYLPRSKLDEDEKNEIIRYVTFRTSDGKIWIGNAERELAMPLIGDSHAATRRREALLKVAREKGVQVIDGYNDAILMPGSNLWWARHAEELASSVEQSLERVRLSPVSSPARDTMISPDRLNVGCRLGCVVYPDYALKMQDAAVRGVLNLPAFQHAGADERDALNEMLDEAAKHCRDSLATNLEILKKIVETVQSILNEHGHNILVTTRLVCLTYELLFRRSQKLPIGELKAENEGAPRVVYVSEKETIGSLASGRTGDYESLALLAAKLNELTNSDSEHQRLSHALDESRVSDELVVRILSRIRDLVEKWRTKGIAGECEICHDVKPRPNERPTDASCR